MLAKEDEETVDVEMIESVLRRGHDKSLRREDVSTTTCRAVNGGSVSNGIFARIQGPVATEAHCVARPLVSPATNHMAHQ